MKRPDRWQEVKAILHSALEVSPSERASFLEKKCGDDLGLRGEVESLIASHDGAAELLESSVPEVHATAVSDSHTDELAGRSLGHYEVIQKLGAGGMGEIYLARDTTLGRNVALKLLPESFTQDGDRLGRFQQEARAASALNHPNILTVHEIGNVDSLNYIATEYVDGDTLRDRINRTPLKITEALEIATQVASALATAHEAGIIHRDIKPENIMLRR
ncbi:MAG TPA: serine/threonine-protein kinase, partial [Pyrinomonadaceae bacterium]